MICRDGILKRYSRPSRPRCEKRWVEAWSSATTSTMARCGVGGISSSSSGQLQEPNVVPGVSYSLYGIGNPWCKLASRTRSCQDAHREALPSDPGLRHGRIPIFSRSKEEMKKIALKKIALITDLVRCTSITECDNKIYIDWFIIFSIQRNIINLKRSKERYE